MQVYRCDVPQTTLAQATRTAVLPDKQIVNAKQLLPVVEKIKEKPSVVVSVVSQGWSAIKGLWSRLTQPSFR